MPKKILCIACSEHQIILCQFSAGLRTTALLGCHSITADILHRPEQAVADLTNILDVRNLRSEEYRLSLPEAAVMLLNRQFPFSSRKKISQALGFELQQSLPFSPENIITDTLLGRPSQQGRPVLAASIPEAYIAALLSLLHDADINPAQLTLSTISTAQVVAAYCNESPTLFIHADVRHTQLIQITEKAVSAAIQLPFGLKNNTGETYQPPAKADAAQTMPPSPVVTSVPCPSADAITADNTNSDERTQRQLRQFARRLSISAQSLPETAVQIILCGSMTKIPACEAIFTQETGIPAITVQRHNAAASLLPSANVEQWAPYLPAFALLPERTSILKKEKLLSFRKGNYAFSKEYSLKDTAVCITGMAAIVMLSAALLFFAQGYQQSRQAEILNSRMLTAVKHALPEVHGSFGHIQYTSILKSRLAQLRGQKNPYAAPQTSILDMLLALHKSTPQHLDVQLENITCSEKAAGISGTADSYATVEKLRTHLANDAHFTAATIQSATSQKEQRRVWFELELRRGK